MKSRCTVSVSTVGVLDTFSTEEQIFALQNMRRKDIEGWLNTEEKEKRLVDRKDKIAYSWNDSR